MDAECGLFVCFKIKRFKKKCITLKILPFFFKITLKLITPAISISLQLFKIFYLNNEHVF